MVMNITPKIQETLYDAYRTGWENAHTLAEFPRRDWVLRKMRLVLRKRIPKSYGNTAQLIAECERSYWEGYQFGKGVGKCDPSNDYPNVITGAVQ